MELSNNYKLFIMYTTYHDIFGYVVEKILNFNNKMGRLIENKEINTYFIEWNNKSLTAEIRIDDIKNSVSNFNRDNESDYNLAKGLCILIDMDIKDFPFK
jgi:hypothetical protein